VVGTLVLVEEVERLPRGERRREPRVLWLWWAGPAGTEPDLGLLWRAYVRRFDLEHTFRFLKQTFGWTSPRFGHPEQADRWTHLTASMPSSRSTSKSPGMLAFSISSRVRKCGGVSFIFSPFYACRFEGAPA